MAVPPTHPCTGSGRIYYLVIVVQPFRNLPVLVHLVGDSHSVVQWITGQWKCLHRHHIRAIVRAQCTLFRLWQESRARPASLGGEWIAHAYREHNVRADALANASKGSWQFHICDNACAGVNYDVVRITAGFDGSKSPYHTQAGLWIDINAQCFFDATIPLSLGSSVATAELIGAIITVECIDRIARSPNLHAAKDSLAQMCNGYKTSCGICQVLVRSISNFWRILFSMYETYFVCVCVCACCFGALLAC